mgnify:CR=1 FL=1
MEIRQPRYFVEICKYRNFTRAADACYISTQGISMAILRLENELNRQLFVRDKQGVTLTPAAEFPDQLDEETKLTWKDDVMELEQEIIFEQNEELKGQEIWAFIEGKVADENAYVGRTYRDAPGVDGYIFINTEEELMSGAFVKVRVTGAYEYDLIGEII